MSEQLKEPKFKRRDRVTCHVATRFSPATGQTLEVIEGPFTDWYGRPCYAVRLPPDMVPADQVPSPAFEIIDECHLSLRARVVKRTVYPLPRGRGQPAPGVGHPAGGRGYSAAGPEYPPAGHGYPAGRHEYPTGGHGHPAAGRGAPYGYHRV
ncbi:hypothetical protein K523DRAFT_322307 [Schizophyllum commune Tattone D]|nr:hypothetical protein K523DRAFT_322307 [Schizophyllum commune Tattone D]